MLAKPHQVVLLLVAGMMPEAADDSDDEDIAQALGQAQMQLLEGLGKKYPQALFYSHYYRWGLLVQVSRDLLVLLSARRSKGGGSCWGGLLDWSAYLICSLS